VHRLLAALLLLIPPALATADDPEVTWAAVVQEQIPALQARASVAQARIEAREAFFAGQIPFGVAFPDLASARLEEPAVLGGRLALLDDRGTLRAAERVAALPSVGGEDRAAELGAALQTALTAEDRADALERRLLLGLRAQLDANPGLARLHPARVELEAALDLAADQAEGGDPEVVDAAQRRAAHLDQELIHLDALITGLRRVAVVPGAAPPAPDQDLGRLDGQQGEHAALRLELLLPFLAADQQVGVEDALVRWWTDQRLADAQARLEAAGRVLEPVEELASRVEELERALADAEQVLADLPPAEAGTLAGLQREVAEVERDAARARLEAVVAAVADAQDAGSRPDADVEATRAQEEATLARQRAEEARRQAQGAQELRAAELEEAWAGSQERATLVWSAVRDARSGREAAHQIRTERLDAQRVAVRQLERLPSLDDERPDPDQVYTELRALVADLCREAMAGGEQVVQAQQARAAGLRQGAAERTELAAEAEAVGDTPAGPLKDAQLKALDNWSTALDDEERALEEAVVVAREARGDVLRALKQAKALLRRAERHASRSARNQASRQWPDDLRLELALIGPNLVSLVRDRASALWNLPRTLGGLTGLWNLWVGSVVVLLIAGGWYVARRNTRVVVRALLARAETLQERLHPSEVRSLREPVQQLALPLVDLVAILFLIPRLDERLPEVAFLLLVALLVVVYRALMAAFDLALVPHPERRPALRLVGRVVFDQARTTVRVLLLWYILLRFAVYLAVGLLDADTLAGLVRFGFRWVGLGLVVWLLHRWEPILRDRMAREHQGNRIVAALSTGPPYTWLRWAFCLASLTFLGARRLLELAYWLGREGSSMGWVLNLVGRYRLAGVEDPEVQVEPVPPELGERILRPVDGEEPFPSRASALHRVIEALASWETEHRRGMVAVVGDRGDGRRTLVGRLVPAVQERGHRVVRAPIRTRLTSWEQAYAWLGDVAGLDGTHEDAEAMSEAIQGLEPRVFIVEDAHLAFLRAVGGFEALRALLLLMNATSERHFWVVVFHVASWAYLSRLRDLVNVEVFRSVVLLEPLGERDLRTLAIGRVEAAGYRADFTGLVRRHLLGGDPTVEVERTTGMYFRLLAEAADGNPDVALRLWRSCLSPGESEGELVVHTGDTITKGIVADLSDVHLFTLAAVRTQDTLDEDELVQVTNMAPSTIRQSVKHLASRGLLQVHQGQVDIPLEALPAITRTLRRRHFLQWTV